MPFPANAVLDNFNRADEGPPPSASWVNSLGTGLKVVSNICRPDSLAASQASTWNTSFQADQEAFFDIATGVPDLASQLGAFIRLVTNTDENSNHYEVDTKTITGAGNDVIQLWKEVGGVFTQLGADFSLGVDFAIGDQIGIDVVGTTVTAYYKTVSQGTRTDSDVGGAGFTGLVYYSVGTVDDFDNFGGGATPVAGATPQRTLMGVGI